MKQDNDKPPKSSPLQQPPILTIKQLSDSQLTNYLKNFTSIQQYKKISQGKDLLNLIQQQTDDNKIEKSIKIICYFFDHVMYEGKVCGLQFVKQLMEIGKIKIFSVLQKYLIPHLADAIQYRSHMKTILRGSTYFVREVNKNEKESKVIDMIRLSNTYCRMSHELLYIWGQMYFPNSLFGQLYSKLSKYCTFPQYPNDFKFYKLIKVQQTIKSTKIKIINQYIQNRKIIPKLSGRSGNSGKSKKIKSKQILQKPKQQELNEKNQEKDNRKWKEEQKQKINKEKVENPDSKIEVAVTSEIVAQDDEQVGFIQLSKIQSKIILKPNKKASKIPSSIIYRESTLEDPVDDACKQIDSKCEIQLKAKNKTRIDVPLGIIDQIYTEDGSSKPAINSSKQTPTRTKKQLEPQLEVIRETQKVVKQKIQTIQQKNNEQNNKQVIEISPVSTERVAYDGNSMDSETSSGKQIEVQNKNTPSTKIGQNNIINVVSSKVNLPKNNNKQQQQMREDKNKNTKQQVIKLNRAKQEQYNEKNVENRRVKAILFSMQTNNEVGNKNQIPKHLQQKTNQQQVKIMRQSKARDTLKKVSTHSDARNTSKLSQNQTQRETIKPIFSNLIEETSSQALGYSISDKDICNASPPKKKQQFLIVQNLSQIEKQKHSEELQEFGFTSRTQLRNTGTPPLVSSKKSLSFKRKRKSSYKLFEDEQQQPQFLKQIQQKPQQQPKIYKKLLNFTTNIYNIKQLCQNPNQKQKIVNENENYEKERRINTQRKLRKFRQIAMTLIPDQKQSNNISTLQTQKVEIEDLRKQISAQLKNIENKVDNKDKQLMNTISCMLKQHESIILSPLTTLTNVKQRNRNFFTENSNEKFLLSKQIPTSKSKQLKTTRRSSLSDIKKKQDYQQGTMLYMMQKRKSIQL